MVLGRPAHTTRLTRNKEDRKTKKQERTYVSSEGCREILKVIPVPATRTRSEMVCCEEDAMVILFYVMFFGWNKYKKTLLGVTAI
jgi:hypothetical protein